MMRWAARMISLVSATVNGCFWYDRYVLSAHSPPSRLWMRKVISNRCGLRSQVPGLSMSRAAESLRVMSSSEQRSMRRTRPRHILPVAAKAGELA